MSGTTMRVYKSPFSMSFCLRMLFSMVYVLWSRFLFSHCFLSCFMWGSLSCSLTNFPFFRGRWMSIFTFTGSMCWMFMLPISHSITSSITWAVTGGSSSKGNYPNSLPSSYGCSLMFSSIFISLDKVSAKVFLIPGMYSNVMFCDSSSTAQLLNWN